MSEDVIMSEETDSWRECRTVEEVARYFKLPDKATESLKKAARDDPPSSIPQFMLGLASDFFTLLKTRPEIKRRDWDLRIFELSGDTRHDDHVFNLFVRFLAETGSPQCIRSNVAQYERLMQEIYPKQKHEEMVKKFQDLERVFHRDQRGQVDVAQRVYNNLVELYRKFDPMRYGSPYTSIIGPSGIGKSFTIQSIARKGLAYVTYVSFVPSNSVAYPGPSTLVGEIADIARIEYMAPGDADKQRATLTIYFECFIAASICHTRLCRKFKIHPVDFFKMQVHSADKYHEYREGLNGYVEGLFQSCSGHPSEDPWAFDHRGYIDKHMDEYEKLVSPLFEKFSRKVSQEGKFKNIRDPSLAQPSVLFCFDEAGWLLNFNQLPFNSVRRALRHQSHPIREDGTRSPEDTFFGVFMDTSSKYNTFVPPRGRDPSAKLTDVHEFMFSPIFKIQSWDILADPEHIAKKISTKVDAKKLFRLGRPNWASQLEIISVKELEEYALTKAYGGDNTRELDDTTCTALLSYRMQFYVNSQVMREQLVAKHLHVIQSISDDRLTMRILQPSEPILAWISLLEMKRNKGCRLKILQCFHKQCSMGSMNSGDIGEMVAALIFLLSFDANQPGYAPKAQQIKIFLGALYGKGLVNELTVNCMEDEDMKSLLEDGHVFFTHFARVGAKTVDDSVLREAWGRGAAFFVPQNTWHYDMLIPVALPKSNAMSCIVVQVKNRQDDVLPGLKLRKDARVCIQNSLTNINFDPKVKAALGIFMALQNLKKPSVEILTPKDKPLSALRPRPSTQPGIRLKTKRPPKESKEDDNVSSLTAAAAESPAAGFPLPDPQTLSSQLGDPKHLVILSAGLDRDLFPNLGFGNLYSEDIGIYNTLNKLVYLQSGADLDNDDYTGSFILGNKAT